MTGKSKPVPWPRRTGPWMATVYWDEVRGRQECVGLDIRPKPGTRPAPLTATELRGLRLQEVIEQARASESQPRQSRRTAPKPGQRLGEKHYVEVARVYRDAWSSGDPKPTLAVQRHFGVSYSTAAKYVLRARRIPVEQGGLPPAVGPGVPGAIVTTGKIRSHARGGSRARAEVIRKGER